MPDVFALAIPAAIGAVAWLYQKAWERLERRVKQYEEIIDALPGFVEGGLDLNKINLALGLSRRLWILAPDSVVQALDRFFDSIENSKGPEAAGLALGELILEMRKNATFWAVFFPRVRTRLKPSDFKIKSAKTPVTIIPVPVSFTLKP